MKTPVRVFLALLGAFIQAVGLCNIHAFADVTEGGVLGATLLLEHWFAISPAISALVLNAACYLFGWRTLGKGFLTASDTLMTLSFCILMALNVVFSNVWGIILKEWKGCSKKTIVVLIVGIVVLIISSFLPQLV